MSLNSSVMQLNNANPGSTIVKSNGTTTQTQTSQSIAALLAQYTGSTGVTTSNSVQSPAVMNNSSGQVSNPNLNPTQGIFNGLVSGNNRQGFTVTFYGNSGRNLVWSPTGSLTTSGQMNMSFENIQIDEMSTVAGMTLDPSLYISKLFVAVPTASLTLPAGTHDGQLKIITLCDYVPISTSSNVIISGSFFVVNGRKDKLMMQSVGSSVTLNWSMQTMAWHLCHTGTY